MISGLFGHKLIFPEFVWPYFGHFSSKIGHEQKINLAILRPCLLCAEVRFQAKMQDWERNSWKGKALPQMRRKT